MCMACAWHVHGIIQAAATEHAGEELFGPSLSADALEDEDGEGGGVGGVGEGGGGRLGASESSEAGVEAAKRPRRRKKNVWGDALKLTAQSKPTALGDMWSVTGGAVVGAVVNGGVRLRGAGDKVGGAMTDLHVSTVVKANIDKLAHDLQSPDAGARHHALELLDAVAPLPARTQLVEAINARIKLSCLLMPPDGVPEFYSPTALHARAMLLQARFLQDAAEIERLARLLTAFAGTYAADAALGDEAEEEKGGENLGTWHTTAG